MTLSEAPVLIETSTSWPLDLTLITAEPKFAGAAAMENDFSTPSKENQKNNSRDLVNCLAPAAETINTSSEASFILDLHTLVPAWLVMAPAAETTSWLQQQRPSIRRQKHPSL